MATATHGSSLDGKVAVVSGSSSGIGAAIAEELSKRGAIVVINYPSDTEKSKAESVQRSLPTGSKSIIVEADLSTTSGPEKLANAAAETFGHIDILVNNAGLMTITNLETSDSLSLAASFDRVLAVNGRGTLLLTQAVLKFLSSKHSRIVNIASATSRDPDPDMSIYAGSKGMIESYTRCWARDLPRKYGCTVNAVAPGPVSTETMQAAPAEFHQLLETRLRRNPVATRMARPEEIAWTVAMLCEERSEWLNGLYVPVTGGDPL